MTPAAAIAYLAFALFAGGMVWRVMAWARAPVPFRIPLTCGQQKSLAGIRAAWLENPWTAAGTACRMALEVLLFRSLARNSRAKLLPGPRFVYRRDPALWAGALLFHVCLLRVIAGHLALFTEPALFGPASRFVDTGLVAALAFLLLRRLVDARLRYISLVSDYLPLALIAIVAGSGVLLRYRAYTDVSAVKRFGMGLATFHPVPLDGTGALFYLHLFAACALAASIPFTKLAHMAGVFLSPTRNLPNDTRARLHRNPWLGPARVRGYAEWEDEYREKMRAAGLPLERE
jgi:nitrate reductase gamma subunit